MTKGRSMSLLLKNAETLAKKAHETQVRKFDNSPYFGHLLEVKTILEHFEFEDETLLSAALLHDILEDTDVTRRELEFIFGSVVLDIIEKLTDDKTLPLPERRNKAIRKLSDQQGYIHAIKLADLISNLSAIPTTWNKEKRADYFGWCEKLIAACNKAPQDMIKLADYLLWNQKGESDDFSVLKNWTECSNLYWSEEKQAFLFVGFSENGDIEAHILSGETEILNVLFRLELLKDLSIDFTNLASVLVVNTLPKSKKPNFACYYVDCFLIRLNCGSVL